MCYNKKQVHFFYNMVLKRFILKKNHFMVNVVSAVLMIQPALAEVCTTPICQQTASEIVDAIDPLVKPCDDFYKFACGGLFKKTFHGKPMSLDILVENEVENQIKRMLTEPIQSSEPKAIQGLKKFFNVCMDEASIEKDGIKSIKNVLQQLGGWPILEGPQWNGKNIKFEELLVKLRSLGYKYSQLFSFVGSYEMTVSPPSVWYEDDKEKDEKYQNFITEVVVLLGSAPEVASTEAQEIVQFRNKLYYISDIGRKYKYNKMTYHDIQQQFDFINWLNFINGIRYPHTKLSEDNIGNFPLTDYFTCLEQLLNETSIRTITNYIIWDAIEAAIPYFPKAFRDAEQRFQKEESSPAKKEESRFEFCRKLAQEILPPTLETLYVRDYFSAERKRSAERIILLIKEEFIDLLNTTKLYDETTRVKAIARAESVDYIIGGPIEILDQEQLKNVFDENENLNTNDFLTIASILNRQNSNNNLGNRNPPNDDYSAYTDVRAYYDSLEHVMVIPATILQGAYYNENRPQFINFGTVGMLLGHQLTHGFIENEYDDFKMWTNATKKSYHERSECITQQASNFEIEGTNLHMNGKQVLEETVCDYNGAEIAHNAYENWVKRHGAEIQLPGLNYTNKQLFWISSARLFCDVVPVNKIENQINYDPRGHPEFRIIGTMSNNKHFAQDFNCPIGSRMNPSDRCQVF